MLPIQIGGLVFTVSHRKRIVTGVTDRGVRVRDVMKWHSLYQSVSHSVTAVVPECRLPLRTASSSHGPWLCLWETLIRPPPPVFFGPLRSSTGFYLNFLQAVPFHSIISSPPTLAHGEGGGSMLRGVEFVLSFLASMAIRHKALCPFPSRFFFP